MHDGPDLKRFVAEGDAVLDLLGGLRRPAARHDSGTTGCTAGLTDGHVHLDHLVLLAREDLPYLSELHDDRVVPAVRIAAGVGWTLVGTDGRDVVRVRTRRGRCGCNRWQPSDGPRLGHTAVYRRPVSVGVRIRTPRAHVRRIHRVR